jgi:hypothetical protein
MTLLLWHTIAPASDPNAGAIWKKIAPHFSAPAEFAEAYGSFSSPLTFANGQPVRTPNDWVKRRQEILAWWHKMMGQWPTLIEKPKIKFVETSRRENFVQHKVRFNWLPDQKTEGYLLIPQGSGKHPAVLTVYYEPETAIGWGEPNRDFAYQLTRRGFVTLSIGTSDATKAKNYALYFPNLDSAQVQPLSMLAYAAANAWYVLAAQANVDSNRIGVLGHSFGGKWAMFAASLFDRFACGAWSDPGIVFDETRPNVNYWEPWYLGYHPPPWRERGIITAENPARGLYPSVVAERHDLHELHALMAPRPFLVSGGSEDPPERWQALNHTVAVNRLLGFENRVALTSRPGHSPTPESNEQIYLFFEYFLKHNGLKTTPKY